MNKIYKIILTLSFFALLNCNDKDTYCSLFDPVPSSVFFKYVDNSNMDLIGEGNKYNTDSIYLFNPDIEDIITIDDEDSTIEFYYEEYSGGNSEIYLKLNSIETDSVRVVYNYRERDHECGGVIAYEEKVFYNNEEVIVSENGYYTIVK